MKWTYLKNIRCVGRNMDNSQSALSTTWVMFFLVMIFLQSNLKEKLKNKWNDRRYKLHLYLRISVLEQDGCVSYGSDNIKATRGQNRTTLLSIFMLYNTPLVAKYYTYQSISQSINHPIHHYLYERVLLYHIEPWLEQKRCNYGLRWKRFLLISVCPIKCGWSQSGVRYCAVGGIGLSHSVHVHWVKEVS